MMGTLLKWTLFGESHGTGVGCVLEGLPAGIKIDRALLERRMAERRPGQSGLTTPRREGDVVRFLSGVLDDVTTGAPLTVFIENRDQRSKDYEALRRRYRPSHADYTGAVKYDGYNDYRGGGHFSARLTAGVVAAGTLAEQFLSTEGIEIKSRLVSVGPVSVSPAEIEDGCLDARLTAPIESARRSGDSVGGIVSTAITGLPVGLGGTTFDGIEGRLALGLFGIPGVKGVDFGAGFELSKMHGSEANDCFYENNGCVQTHTNASGGINGGISNGMPVTHRCVFRPTPSIAMTQTSLDFESMTEVAFAIEGRHDPCIAVRGVPVVRAMTALVTADLFLMGK